MFQFFSISPSLLAVDGDVDLVPPPRDEGLPGGHQLVLAGLVDPAVLTVVPVEALNLKHMGSGIYSNFRY